MNREEMIEIAAREITPFSYDSPYCLECGGAGFIAQIFREEGLTPCPKCSTVKILGQTVYQSPLINYDPKYGIYGHGTAV